MAQVPMFSLAVSDDPEAMENIFRTSLVENPATQKVFAVFSKADVKPEAFQVLNLPTETNKQVVQPSQEGFQRIISGVWFMPDTDYPRINEQGDVYTARMSKDELMQAHINFKKNGASSFDVMHNGQVVEGLTTIETWQLYDYNQLSPVLLNSIQDLGYTEDMIPIGTVFMSVYVANEEFFYSQIIDPATGQPRPQGFSIEGSFILQQIDCPDEDKNPDGPCKYNKQNMKYKEMFNKMGLDQEMGTLITKENEKLSFTNEGIKLDSELVGDKEFILTSGFSIIVREGKLADFGFEEVAPNAGESAAAATETQPAEPAVIEQPAEVIEPVEPAVEPVVEPTMQELIDKGIAEALKTKTIGDTSDKDAIIADLQSKLDKVATAQQEAALNNQAVPAQPITDKPSNYDPATHRVKEVGGKKFYLPK